MTRLNTLTRTTSLLWSTGCRRQVCLCNGAIHACCTVSVLRHVCGDARRLTPTCTVAVCRWMGHGDRPHVHVPHGLEQHQRDFVVPSHEAKGGGRPNRISTTQLAYYLAPPFACPGQCHLCLTKKNTQIAQPWGDIFSFSILIADLIGICIYIYIQIYTDTYIYIYIYITII